MNKNLNLIAKELFGKIRTQFSNVKLGDENSKVTSKPEEARFFDFDYTDNGEVLGRVSISISTEDGIVVIYSADIVSDKDSYAKKKFFNFLREIREFAKQHLMGFDTRDIAKSNLEKRDYEFLSKNIGESKMSESKLFGTSKTSYQNLGDAKIIVKHSAPVNFENPAGRTQKIESIYIENIEGERFKYPYKHLNGARALAQHIAHGGTPYDNIGKHVIGLSEELSKLRMFKNYVERNPVISENMGSIHSKVMERIDSVKKEILELQSTSRYESFVESFTETEAKEIPEDVLNDWIDRLTIKTFNEELKNVFPYIFKIVDESDIPVKEVSAEELLNAVVENSEDQFEDTVAIPEFSDYERHLDKIVGEAKDIFSDDNQEAIDKLNQLLSQPFPVGVDGTNAIEGLSDIIDDEELMDIFRELADVSPESDVKSILKDYFQMKDQENGTDVSSKLQFDAEPAPAEPVAAEPAPAEVPAEPVAAEPAPAEVPAEPAPQPQMAGIENKGSKLAEVIGRAIKAGMKLEDTFEVGGKTLTLKDAIEKAGLTTETFFHNKTESLQEELVEFIKSMFNTEEGSFPKGETGVLIACEKKFGEGAVPMAKQVIGKLHQLSEMQRMKKLAGLAN